LITNIYKNIGKSDINLYKFNAKKNWQITSASFSDYNVKLNIGIKSPYYETFDLGDDINDDGSYKRLIYDSINKLYYDENYYVDADKFLYITRSLSSRLLLLEIPNNLYDLKVNSFKLVSGSVEYVDDTFYNLKISGSNTCVGNIFYNTGHIVITDETIQGEILSGFDYIQFESDVRLNQLSININIEPTEFNISNGENYKTVYQLYSGSLLNSLDDLPPYFTTIGFYDDNNTLLAVTKLAQPLKRHDYFSTMINTKLIL